LTSTQVYKIPKNPTKSRYFVILTPTVVRCNQDAAKAIIRGSYRSIMRMPLTMKLNARQIETAKPKEKTYKLADG
ncbi:hypothetical protein, partial [Xenorhabdus szentirmaii]|uniref:hypothetical protein n=1 Tax=Xenorhabdus szentirmaii TaxID=290112 RepID=UPI002B40774B